MTETKRKEAHVWERGDLDWYVEPKRATKQLLKHETFLGQIHDPCCGGGNIVTELRAAGYNATGSDLVDRAGGPEWFTGVEDFLKVTWRRYDNVVMNPPFFKAKGTESFIRHAVASTRGKVCAFTEARFLFGNGRADGLYAEIPPARVYLITPRPSCPPGEFLLAGGEAKGGTQDWIWMVWDNVARSQGTSLYWMRKGDLA